MAFTVQNYNPFPGTRLARNPPMLYICVGVLACGIILTALNVYELRNMQREHFDGHKYGPVAEGREEAVRPKYWLYGKRLDSGYLSHVMAVFDRTGYARGDENTEDWDVLWAHDYPFLKLADKLHSLEPHQKVNHFPGSGWVTNKVELARTPLTHIPPAFKMPHEREKLIAHANKHPEKLWVQKNSNHRGIKIQKIADLDLKAEGTFVQEYIAKPLLIDARKFDIGVYAVLTSIRPLRLYLYDEDALFRFCPKDYHPFDPADLKRYVVEDDYTPMWKMPSLKHYYTDLGFSFKESFNMYMKSKGLNPDRVWQQIDESIIEVFTSKENQLIQSTTNYRSTRNFFEMMRFDYVLDEESNIYLMEANMSPNLSSAHFSDNRLLYEQVIYNLLSLVGVARHISHDSLRIRSNDEVNMQVSDKNILVSLDVCASDECQDCSALKCKVCRSCLTIEDKLHLKQAFLEHSNRLGCRRLYPRPMHHLRTNTRAAEDWLPSNMSVSNKLMHLWFYGKCQQDVQWCS
ncbi:PREDICTED: tubulin polyglutamylase TTLL4-like [Priapulus caudatus]|uniref:Tubulin polyglutamylase TTLL4-like n=1 Tax=Priapulus caudatus TaxID=37621 RepID=A0ABM1EJM2_PRICU|nr:PREDICTED: tubulin polyglutamylase TTLL4-like [Priapulus caudatus]